jgi:ATP-dependent Clp protease adapter protein ClpS
MDSITRPSARVDAVPLIDAVFGERRRRMRSALFALASLAVSVVVGWLVPMPAKAAVLAVCILAVVGGWLNMRKQKRRRGLGLEVWKATHRAMAAAEGSGKAYLQAVPLLVVALLDDEIVRMVVERTGVDVDALRGRLRSVALEAEDRTESYRGVAPLEVSMQGLEPLIARAASYARSDHPVLSLGVLVAACDVPSAVRRELRTAGLSRARLARAMIDMKAPIYPRWTEEDAEARDLRAVVFHNDDETTQEFVVETLCDVFALEITEAMRLTRAVHDAGSAEIRRAGEIRAHELAKEVRRRASAIGYPLRVTIEKPAGIL